MKGCFSRRTLAGTDGPTSMGESKWQGITGNPTSPPCPSCGTRCLGRMSVCRIGATNNRPPLRASNDCFQVSFHLNGKTEYAFGERSGALASRNACSRLTISSALSEVKANSEMRYPSGGKTCWTRRHRAHRPWHGTVRDTGQVEPPLAGLLASTASVTSVRVRLWKNATSQTPSEIDV